MNTHTDLKTTVKVDPHSELWTRLQSFEFDEPGAVFCFKDRLARENGWTRPFAARVIEEYKRFVFLAMTAGHPVTPSDQVDQAWHLHLTYTVSYWDRLCGNVLPKPLHHHPTQGGTSEGRKFTDWYAKTKASYVKVFGQEPPADIWPDGSTRFGDDAHFERVNTARHWVISKDRAKRAGRLGVAIGSIAAVAGCGPLLIGAGGIGAGFTTFVVGIVLAIILIAVIGAIGKATNAGQPGRNGRRQRRRDDAGWSSSPMFFSTTDSASHTSGGHHGHHHHGGHHGENCGQSGHHHSGHHSGHSHESSSGGHSHGGDSGHSGCGSSDSGSSGCSSGSDGGSSGCGSSGCGSSGCSS